MDNLTPNTQFHGRIIKCVGGLYTVRMDGVPCDGDPVSGRDIECRARGGCRQTGLLVGDFVTVEIADGHAADAADLARGGLAISAVSDRKNALIRPPLANLDAVLVVLASAAPAPDLLTVDKLLSILEYNRIEPILIIGKGELNPDEAERIRALYTNAGYRVFVLSCQTGEGVDAVRDFIKNDLGAMTTAVAGASGTGKSTLLNTLFPELSLTTGVISRRIERGKNTTRHVQLFPLEGGGYIADTAGFSLLDFARFDFFRKDDLPETMREFRPYLEMGCRYTDCPHLRGTDCTILDAVRDGRIAPSRHQSYVHMYEILKDKHTWDK